MKKIVVVDDEIEIARLVVCCLSDAGYDAVSFYDGNSALEYIQSNEVDLAVLDIMLPDVDGFTLCQQIRKKYFFPIIMLTARVEAIDRITGLNIGADDYVTKPFQPLELVARVKTQLRRYTQYNFQNSNIPAPDSDQIDIRGLSINKKIHKCMLNGKEITLTPIEFKILWYMCIHQGEVISSEQLFETVWGEDFLDNNNTVMAHIARLREKLKEPSRKPKYIKTVWGVGYTIE